MVTVPDHYFCKYPVTTKRYRRFISFLEEKLIYHKLSPELYVVKLLYYTESIKEYKDYLEKYKGKWHEVFISKFDNDKRFNGDDQPVVGINWYAALAYCFWLSCLEQEATAELEDIRRLGGFYRLLKEEEWEWVAGGNPDGSLRNYPWPADKGEPNPNLANFNRNVGTTTTVGRYPGGATPHGLMDMAGNVWEWMENLYKEGEPYRALRGGAWYNAVSSLHCAARSRYDPVYGGRSGGFRVVWSQS